MREEVGQKKKKKTFFVFSSYPNGPQVTVKEDKYAIIKENCLKVKLLSWKHLNM